jgi:hypothetical protein
MRNRAVLRHLSCQCRSWPANAFGYLLDHPRMEDESRAAAR